MSSTNPEPLGDRVPQLRPPAAARAAVLKRIKVVHSIVWALFAGCIFAIPIASLYGDNQAAFMPSINRSAYLLPCGSVANGLRAVWVAGTV